MTLRDITQNQIEAAKKLCEEKRVEYFRTFRLREVDFTDEKKLARLWERAFSEGFKAGLATLKPHVPHDDGK